MALKRRQSRPLHDAPGGFIVKIREAAGIDRARASQP
jgi:hypothetical protein